MIILYCLKPWRILGPSPAWAPRPGPSSLMSKSSSISYRHPQRKGGLRHRTPRQPNRWCSHYLPLACHFLPAFILCRFPPPRLTGARPRHSYFRPRRRPSCVFFPRPRSLRPPSLQCRCTGSSSPRLCSRWSRVVSLRVDGAAIALDLAD